MRRDFLVFWVAALGGILLFLTPGSASAQKKEKYWGIGSFSKYVSIPGASRVGGEACTACHADVSRSFAHAFHAQQGIECEDCHGPASLHVEGGGDISKIVSFRQRSVRDANGACLNCHAKDESVRHWMSGAHASNHVRCTDCHQVHQSALESAHEGQWRFDTATRGAFTAASVSPETNVVVRPHSATNDACLKCHQTQNAQLSMPYHHPLREGKMGCDDCHDPHGGRAGNNLRAANANELCLTCHAQYRGPFAYQHPPVSENCMTCHNVHGSPNTNMLNVSEPALCLQCHAGHHNGAGLPLPDRCTNCHSSIHGTDVPTPSGGSRFMDKGCSEVALRAINGAPTCSDPPAGAVAGHGHPTVSAARMGSTASHMHMPLSGVGAASGALAMMPSGFLPSVSGGNMQAGGSNQAGPEEQAGAFSAYSIMSGGYRLIDGSGFLGRVGEYDTLQQSAGTNAATAYVSTQSHLTFVSQANVLSGDDYSTGSQLTLGERLQLGLFIRSFEQQQDHYPFYAFPVLDVNPNFPCFGPCDTNGDAVPSGATFGVRRRLGSAYARLKVPKLPVHLFVKGNWEARAGVSQFRYLDENTLPIASAACGTQCHYNSQPQDVNYTTRDIGGGVDVDLGAARLTWEHRFSSFNDRLIFPTGTFTGEFTPEADSFGVSTRPGFGPPSGPTPPDILLGIGGVANFPVGIPAPNQASTDSVRLNWTFSPELTFNGNVSYTRLRDLYTRYPQNSFDTDETVVWRPLHRLGVTAEYHQQNMINNFTPYYSLYGNVSYHNHWEGVRLEYELPLGFDLEGRYKRSGITRSNANLWPQFYSVDNTDLPLSFVGTSAANPTGFSTIVGSTSSNTAALAVRYHHGGWGARTGYEWTGTDHPGSLIVPQSDNRVFANVWLTPKNWLTFSNDLNIDVQNAFPAVPLPNTPNGTPRPLAFPTFNVNIQGLPPFFQRRYRFYTETASAALRPVQGWNLGLGYSYQQNNLSTYMAFQNDSSTGYILDEPLVPYKQITGAVWGETTYTFQKRLGLNLRFTFNNSRSGYRPDLNPADAARLGNLFLQSPASPTPFNPAAFGTPGQPICMPGAPTALCNLQFSSTQISQVIVPQWIGQSKVFYHFPKQFEGGLTFYYGSYRDALNPNLNGVLRTFNLYVGRSW